MVRLCTKLRSVSFLLPPSPLDLEGALNFPACPQILKAEFWEKGKNKSGQVGPHYFVHYKGWKQTCVVFSLFLPFPPPPSSRCAAGLTLFRPNRSWDEWVPEDRLNKFNEEGIRKQKMLIEAQKARDAAEREAAKAAEAIENARRGQVPQGGGAPSVPAAVGRGISGTSRGAKRGRDGDVRFFFSPALLLLRRLTRA